jgi:Fe-S cluster assembly protein SufD
MRNHVSIATLDDAAALPGPDWLRQRRTASMARFLACELPTPADEIWRYSRIDELDLSAFPSLSGESAPAAAPDLDPLAFLGLGAAPRSALIVTVDGRIVSTDVDDQVDRGLSIGGGEDLVGRLTDTVKPWDAFVELNRALTPEPVVLRAAPGAVIEHPVYVVHRVAGAGAAFPSLAIEVGPDAHLTVVEVLVSPADLVAFVAPVSEVDVASGGELHHLVVQQLGRRVWQTAYHSSRVGSDASLEVFNVALGGDYARVRTDSRLSGAGGSTQLLALYFGDGTQMHDFRTLQDHEGQKSTSDLVFKGAVIEEARSAYSGLIRVRPGAAGTKAFQTNRNLILSDSGLATYSVPNLEIEENDVMCSHASATGPIDPSQRFYLESRGVPTEMADRLIVFGFFDDLLHRLPVAEMRAPLRALITSKLSAARIGEA